MIIIDVINKVIRKLTRKLIKIVFLNPRVIRLIFSAL